MQYEVLAAHIIYPEDFQPCFSITIHGGDTTSFVDEIVDLLNDCVCRDCVFKIKDAPQEIVEAKPEQQPTAEVQH